MTKTEISQDLVGFVICDEVAYMDMVEMLSKDYNLKQWAIDLKSFAQNSINKTGHFFNVFEIDEIDWDEFAKLLFDADVDAYDNW